MKQFQGFSWHDIFLAARQGASTEDHPVTEELARIKKYMGNLKALGQGAAEEQARLKVSLEMSCRL